MSRTYFKNQLYYFAFEKEQKAKKQEDLKKQKEKKEKFAKSTRGQALQKYKDIKKEQTQKNTQQMHKHIQVDDSLTLKKQTSEKNKDQEDSQAKQFLKSLKKKDSNSNSNKNTNILSANFKPLSKLVIKEEVVVEKTQGQQKQEKIKNHMSFKKLQNNLKKVLFVSNPDNKDVTDGKQKDLQRTGTKQQGDQEQNDEKPDIKQAKQDVQQKDRKGKTKLIKKQNNYVRLDLKRKYGERYTGKINEYRRKYTKNGRLKPKYRIQAQISLQDGEFYNNYISSLSSALCMTLNLEEEDDSQNSSQQFQKYTNNNAMEWDKGSLTEYMHKFFGFDAFRQGQYETILNMLNKKSTIFVSQTASGKSLTYILSSMILGGLSIVISPLISLMLDQLNHLPKRFPAACISSLINREQRNRIIKMVHEGRVNLLFITPESLQTDFIYHLQDFPPVNFVAIDEAHSLSELSHNFRTSFLALGDVVLNMIKYKSEKPTVLGLTATANIETVISIKQKLNIQEEIRSNKTMNKNIYITVSKEKGVNKYESLIKYLHIPIIYRCKGILIYARTRRIMEEVFNFVSNSSSFSVAMYHSALSNKQKTQTLKQFRQGTKKIVVATIALGMGLDFQNLQCVIHINMPKSIENYVQEVGRAGRRQRRAYCHLFLDETDYITERNYIIADLLEKSLLKLLYSCLKTYSRQNFEKITEKVKNKQIKQALNQEPKVIKRTKISIVNENDEEYLKNIYQQSEQQIDTITVRNVQNVKSIEQIKILQKQEQQRQRVIRVATLMLELTKTDDNGNIIINEQNEEDQDDALDDKDQKQINQPLLEDQGEGYYETANINTKLFYARSQKLKQLTQLRQQVILTLLIKIESLLKDDKDIKFKVLPLSFEQIKIGFFRNNQQEVKKQSQFFRNLINGCKTVRGTTYVNLVRKCNLLGMKPIQLLANLYRLSNLYTIKIQLQTPIFLWQFQGKQDNGQNQQDQQLSELVKRGFNKLLSDEYLTKVVNEVNNVQKTSITKLNIFYSLAFNHSRLHMANIIQRNLIIPHQQQIRQDCITKQFDNYFKSNLQQFYMRITDNEQQIVIPTQMISRQDEREIFECISLFFKQEIANIMQPRSKQEYVATIRQLIGQYQNGKIITKIMMGVNSGEVSWKIYGTRSYWMLFKLKNYEQLLQAVRKQLKQYISIFQIQHL